MSDSRDPALHAELAAGLAALGLAAALAAPLLAYLALLDRWNRTYNLTAIRDPREMVAKHLLDSLAMHAHVRDLETLADLGSGAGLPGIPLAIALPELRVTLVESAGKKVRFLREAVRTLRLDNA
ncbi:MAG: 16S rRNA (guanine(527)-N(7))-methyltransferase RsmG, partial [Luteimonas sp.]